MSRRHGVRGNCPQVTVQLRPFTFGEKRMIVEYDKEIDVVYISKFVDHRWIQVGFTSDEVEQIVTARKKNETEICV
jgi:hypothetical protein